MRIQHRMICQPSCKISAVKARGVREGKGGKEDGRREERRKGGGRREESGKGREERLEKKC